MINKYFLILFAFCLIKTFSMQAQDNFGFVKGEIIKKSGDTIKCFVEMSTNYGELVSYKMKINSPQVTINKSDIKFLKTPYNRFENILLNKHEQLMTVLADGKIGLFSFMFFGEPKIVGNITTTNLTYIIYLIRKENILYEVKYSNFKKLLRVQLSDCINLITKIDNKKYKFENLQTVIEEYNSCN